MNPRFQTPAVSLWSELILSCLAVYFLANFEAMTDSFVFTMWIFYGMAAVSVFILRRRDVAAHRPYRVPGYPYVPAIFIGSAIVMTVLSFRDDPTRSSIWIGVLLAGVPVYYAWRWLFAERMKKEG